MPHQYNEEIYLSLLYNRKAQAIKDLKINAVAMLVCLICFVVSWHDWWAMYWLLLSMVTSITTLWMCLTVRWINEEITVSLNSY